MAQELKAPASEVSLDRVQRVLRQAKSAIRNAYDAEGLLTDQALTAEDALILLIRDLQAGARVVA